MPGMHLYHFLHTEAEDEMWGEKVYSRVLNKTSSKIRQAQGFAITFRKWQIGRTSKDFDLISDYSFRPLCSFFCAVILQGSVKLVFRLWCVCNSYLQHTCTYTTWGAKGWVIIRALLLLWHVGQSNRGCHFGLEVDFHRKCTKKKPTHISILEASNMTKYFLKRMAIRVLYIGSAICWWWWEEGGYDFISRKCRRWIR